MASQKIQLNLMVNQLNILFLPSYYATRPSDKVSKT